MSGLIALSLSIGVLGGIAAWAALGPLSEIILIWAVFIAWGCYFHSGADTEALKSTIISNILGSVLAVIVIALIINVTIPFGAPIMVGITVFALVFASKLPLFANIPAGVYGYAGTVGYILQTPGKFNMESLLPTLGLLIVSFIVGAVLGMASSKLSGVLTKS